LIGKQTTKLLIINILKRLFRRIGSRKSKEIGIAILLLLISSISRAASLEEALGEAAEYFVLTAVRIESGQELVIQKIVNYHSRNEDETGKRIKEELLTAFEKQSPDFKLLRNSKADRRNEIVLIGTYEQRAKSTSVRLRINKGDEILAQYEVEYDSERVHRRTLVAVLDIEAENLSKHQRKAFSDIFRTYLNDADIFDLASNAELDKLDADKIQKTTGCTRDTCATIIGEQLGVDRVISTSIFKVTNEMFILSSKMMDIQSGSILVSRTIEHAGSLRDLKKPLKKMADHLTTSSDDLEARQAITPEHIRTLDEALDEAAEYFVKQAVRIEPNQKLHILGIVNQNSMQNDMTGKQIETEMYFALERQLPDYQLFLGEGTGRDDEIYLAGAYTLKADNITVHLKIYKGQEILAQYEVDYSTKSRFKALVAVLDIEAEMLNRSQRKAFSEIFRSVLSEIGIFNMASSADIDKLDPDAIQKETGCSRDSCATVIGEQLGVDRVISSTFSKVSEDSYVLSAKLIDIKDGSILISKIIEHDGDLTTFRAVVEQLAYDLTGKPKLLETYSETSVLDYKWHYSAIGIALVSLWLATDNTNKYNELTSKNNDLETQYNEALSQSELDSIQSEYSANQNDMKSHKSTIEIFNALTALALLWESYLLVFSDYSLFAKELSSPPIRPFHLVFNPDRNENLIRAEIRYTWRF
jgi:hypothetical protein